MLFGNVINEVTINSIHHVSDQTSVNVLAKKSLNNDSNRIQAQEARKYTEEIPRCGNCWCHKPGYRRIGEVKPVLPTRRYPRSIQRGLHRNVRLLTKFYNEGSCATVAAAWKTNDEECRWIAYGDSVVFHYNPPRLVSCKDPLEEEGFRSGVFHIDNASW